MKDKFAIIGGDIHKLVSERAASKMPYIGWSIKEKKGWVWIPLKDEKVDYTKGKWVWIEYGVD